MATRKIKDAKDLSTNELIYFKGHAKATYMSDGRSVEDAINNIPIGGGGEGGSISEADIAAMGFTKNLGTITEVKMNGASKGTSGVVDLGNVITSHQDISGKVDKVTGKGLSTEDFTSALKSKLEGLTNYDDTEISNAVSSLQTQINTLVSGNANDAINSFNEIIAFLDGVKDTQDLSSIIASIEQQIAAKMDKVTLATVATSGSYNDLSNKPTIPSAVTESTVSGWGFTKNTGTYSKPSGGIPKTDLASAVQTSLSKADTALQTSQYGEHTCIEVSAFSDPISGLIYALPDAATGDEDLVLAGASRLDDYTLVRCGGIWDRDGISYVLPSEANGNEDDILVTRDTLKTINGQSIFGDGNIVIEGGGGSSSGTKEIVTVLGGLIDEIEPNKIYLVDTNGDDVEIQSIYVPIDDSYAEFTVIIDFNSHSAGGDSVAPTIILPSEIKWANGSIPDLQGYTSCELSIVYYATAINSGYHAVLTPFKYVE